MHDFPSDRPTIAILYPGELGARFGQLCSGAGYRVVTTLEGRSAATRSRSLAVGFELLPNLTDVAREAHIVLSLVPPRAAIDTARAFLAARTPSSPAATYVDVNSISPDSALAVAHLVQSQGMAFVDASVHGLAINLGSSATLYLSGERSNQLAELFLPLMQVCNLGPGPGRASMFKMLLGGMSKGLVALFIEMATTARQAELLDEFIAACGQFYPGVLKAIERLLPTYPAHVARRADEMRELEAAMHALGLRPGLIHEAKGLLGRLADSGFGTPGSTSAVSAPSLTELIEMIFAHHPLANTDHRAHGTDASRATSFPFTSPQASYSCIHAED